MRALWPSRPVTADRRYYGSFRPCASQTSGTLVVRYSRPRGFTACAFPFASTRQARRRRDDRFQGSTSEPDPCSRRLKAGRRVGRKQAFADTAPGTPFKVPVLTSSNPVSTRHRRFTFVRLHGPYLTRFCRAF